MFRLLALPLMLVPAAAMACGSSELGAITLRDPWARATLAPGRPAAFYVEIENRGESDDALIGVSTPVAGMAMLHRSEIVAGRASMAHVAAVPLPAGQTVRLAPGGVHAMLMQTGAALRPGDSFAVTLILQDAGEVTVQTSVMGLAAEAPDCR